MFTEGKIEGVSTKELRQFHDSRGWLAETYRTDELGDYRPEMGYVSVTFPNVARGPHEHLEQTDYFCFLGRFTLYLWDNRKDSVTFKNKLVIENADRLIVTVPPGVVHAYKNTGDAEGMVLNFPDRLFAGWGRKEKVDEVRYENDPASPFNI
ncbi:MAG TPA: dTDP-4-dehydrorhamnose 3,5-epimerase family protein [Thermodesulfovibrionales bacterium]|nr:dTDP-4-dehydrorhamnose 3,5-epimerase family protein [Thermodesulfovibrionales bacterium]